MTWYRDAERELGELAAAVQDQRPIRLTNLERLAADLVSSLKESDELVVAALSDPAGQPLVTNLIHVAILATKMGIGLGYYGRELERLALGGLVHDAGIFAVPQSFVTKSGRLSPDERRVVERHPELGGAAILRAGSEYHWLSQLVKHAHERSNGLGYPNRLKERQISEMAQIIGVADIFDALVSTRPYRRRLLPHQAIKELLVAERTAFPREIVKALVEQLSVYPLGTVVRLSTGEEGVVVAVNVRYPLRPVVRVEERGLSEGSAGRKVDLSLTPLVGIVDALEAPMIGRLVFPAAAETRPRGGTHQPSDEFASILESLDAIASTIQGVVKARTSPEATAISPNRKTEDDKSARSKSLDPAFQQEVIGLFALEAQEWLGQIRSALRRFGGRIDGPVRSNLYGIILNGITNLAKSAATVRLPEVEAMAAQLLPILRHIGRPETGAMRGSIRPLQVGIEELSATVQRLVPEAPALAGTDDSTTSAAQRMQEAESVPHGTEDPNVVVRTEPGPSVDEAGPSMSLLAALHELQRARARSVQPARDVLEAIIQRAEQESGPEPTPVDVAVIGRILRDLDRLDDDFLHEVHDRVPAMIDVIGKLNARGVGDFITASQLDPIFGHLESLHDAAKTIQAATIMTFLQGIKSFLSATAYRKVAALPERLEAVDARLQALVPMAEQWVHLGRLERAAIQEILPSRSR